MSSVLEDIDVTILANQISYLPDLVGIMYELFDECISIFEYLQYRFLIHDWRTGDQVIWISGNYRQTLELLNVVEPRRPSIMLLIIAGGT